MRTPARIVVPVAAAALPLTSCSSTANDTGGDQISLITDGTLTVCTNPPYEPFEFEQDGKVVGLDMDIVNEVAKDLGVELAIKVTLFEGIQSGEDLNSSNCDVVTSGITINDVRESKMDFSEPYFDADQGLLVPAGSSLASVEDLAGTRRPWSASKYGPEKSIFDSRTSLMVMPEATTSQLLELRSSPDWMPSNSVTLIASSTPRSFATSFTMSMSRPTTLPSCSNSNGSYGGLVQTVRVPSVISEI